MLADEIFGWVEYSRVVDKHSPALTAVTSEDFWQPGGLRQP